MAGPARPNSTRWLLAFAVPAIAAAACAVWWMRASRKAPAEAAPPKPSDPPEPARTAPADPYAAARSLVLLRDGRPHATLWWEGVPQSVRDTALEPGAVSTILRKDYTGPAACGACHEKNYKLWQEHPHRWMNAPASDETVFGDFSGVSIVFMRGTATFYREGAERRMRLSRDGIERVYRVTRTIGRRFFQSYVGRLVEGPDPPEAEAWHMDLHLPFTYWLERKQWAPETHITEVEYPDDKRPLDPFGPGGQVVGYAQQCASCHTTWPEGDRIFRAGQSTLLAYPFPVSFAGAAYLKEAHPEILAPERPLDQVSTAEMNEIVYQVKSLHATEHAVTLGISCEACHNGGRAHAQASTATATSLKPYFFPASPHLFVAAPSAEAAHGRNAWNKNWACARCHSGGIDTHYAFGMSTYNSREFDDAMLGACYNPARAQARGMEALTCVTCHNPHQATGPRWPHTPAQDDARCLKCHTQFEAEAARFAHTRHQSGAGSHCMDCHMPRINEGLQDVVRTHAIFKPTDAKTIEAGHPNACNLCHVEKPIDWTLGHLEKWYAKRFDAERLAASYPERGAPATLNWLNNPHEGTRLAAVAALAEARAWWAVTRMSEALDDPYLVNRQFAERHLDRMLGVRIRDFGYHYYMVSREERREPLARARKALEALATERAQAEREAAGLPERETPSVPVPRVDFASQIQPVFKAHCHRCHGPEKQKGELRLDLRADALKGGQSGRVLIPGDPEKSEVLRRLHLPEDDPHFMPQEGRRLPEEVLRRVRDWIAQGGEWPK